MKEEENKSETRQRMLEIVGMVILEPAQILTYTASELLTACYFNFLLQAVTLNYIIIHQATELLHGGCGEK